MSRTLGPRPKAVKGRCQAPQTADADALARHGLQLPGDPLQRRIVNAAVFLAENGDPDQDLDKLDDVQNAPPIPKPRPETVPDADVTSGVEFVNPSGKGIRGYDAKGSGAFHASRNNRSGTHQGVDYITEPGQDVVSVISGTVTKLGYAYASDTRYRIVDVTHDNGLYVRHFYVKPNASLAVGDTVIAGEVIGTAQRLNDKPDLEGITEHVHIEFRTSKDHYFDPTPHIPVR